MWWSWLAACGFELPRRVPEGVAAPCEIPAIDGDRILADIRTLSRAPRRSEARRAEVRRWLRERLPALEERPFTISGVSGVNLATPKQPVLVGAHYDTVEDTPGADDDASGVAVVLELARVLPDAPVTWAFFDAEEPHQAAVGPEPRNYAFGSQAFVDADPDWSRAYVLDAVGFSCADCQQVPPGVPRFLVEVDGEAIYWIVDAPTGPTDPWADLVATAAAASPRAVRAVAIPGRGLSLAQSRFSDHAPFWDAGVPAVLVTDTALLRNARYHRPGDTADTLDRGLLESVARGLAAALRCPPPPPGDAG